LTIGLRAWLSVVMLAGFLLVAGLQLALVSVPVLLVLIMLPGSDALRIGVPLCTATVGVMAYATWRALRIRRADPAGIPVTRAESPRLWAVLDAAAEAAGVKPPDGVIVVAEAAATLRERTRLLGLIGGRRDLYLGFALLQAWDIAHLKAILAHELAHGSPRLSRLAPLASRSRVVVGRVVPRIPRNNPAGPLLRAYAALYRRVDAPFSRAQELNADRIASEFAGTKAAAGVLRDLPALEALQRIFHAEYVGPGWRAGHVPDDMFGGFLRVLAARADELVLLRARGAAPPGPWDPHPPLAERLAALAAPAGASGPASPIGPSGPASPTGAFGPVSPPGVSGLASPAEASGPGSPAAVTAEASDPAVAAAATVVAPDRASGVGSSAATSEPFSAAGRPAVAAEPAAAPGATANQLSAAGGSAVAADPVLPARAPSAVSDDPVAAHDEDLVPDLPGLGRALQAVAFPPQGRTIVGWDDFFSAARTAEMEREANAALGTISRAAGTPVTSAAEVIDLAADGRLHKAAEKVFPDLPPDETAGRVGELVTLLLALAALHGGVARWRHSWTGTAELVTLDGGHLDLAGFAAQIGDPSTVGAARERLAAMGIDVAAAPSAENARADVIGGVVNLSVDGARTDLLIVDTGLLLVPGLPRARNGAAKRRLAEFAAADAAQRDRAVPGSRFVPYADVAGATRTRRTLKSWDLSLRDGGTLTLRTALDSDELPGGWAALDEAMAFLARTR
jgi:Zn-dependent protease with chaperone function